MAWVLGPFLVLGLAGGVLWWLLAEPPYFVRTETTAVMGQAELGKRIPVDGIFASIGALGSLVLGFALMAWRRRDPLLVLLVGVVASVLAGYVALKLGERLGHRDVQALVARAGVGDTIVDTLSVITDWVIAAWPVGFLVAAVSSLLGSARGMAEPPPTTGPLRPHPRARSVSVASSTRTRSAGATSRSTPRRPAET